MASFDVLKHVVDVHCHPTDSEITSEAIQALPITICAMATRHSDQSLVAELARVHPDKVVPCFGYHPWFAHWISLIPGTPPPKDVHYRDLFLGREHSTANDRPDDAQALGKMLHALPDPISLDDCISGLQHNFQEFPSALLGEIGLDRSARIPLDHQSERRELSQFTIPFEHQLSLVEAQLDLAVKFKRNVSFHSVKAQKATIDLLDRMKKKHGSDWLQISVDLHSCGLSPETWKDIEKKHPNVFLSLSTAINGRSPAHRKLISMASADRLLVESDIHVIDQCAERTWSMLCTVAEVRGWDIEDVWDEDVEEERWGAVRKLELNWVRFMAGDHEEVPSSKKWRRRSGNK